MSGQIAALALCLFRRDDGALLLAYGTDEVKGESFYRPLGGHIEYGERAADAARREIREELGAEVGELRLLSIFENLFVYRGEPGHELIWLYETRLLDASLYERDVIEAIEADATFEARWVPLEAFAQGEERLYPDGLLELLAGDTLQT